VSTHLFAAVVGEVVTNGAHSHESSSFFIQIDLLRETILNQSTSHLII
jgi:hypothetical protein